MRSMLLLLTGAACLWSGAAVADKFTATCECGKADPSHVLPAGDRADHRFGVEAIKCTWPKPWDIGGDKAKDGVATHMVEVEGERVHFRGVHEVTMQSGDKVALPYRGSGVSKENHYAHSKGTFTIGEGTGKLKGIKGKGTFSCKSAGESLACDLEGEYELGK